MNFFRGVMGGQPAGPQPTGAETDRRDAVRALKSLSKKYRFEVGTQAMDHLVHVLQTDRSDSEILGYALDTLYNIICNDEEEEQDMAATPPIPVSGKHKNMPVSDENAQKQEEDLGVLFTDKFLGDSENVTLLLTLLEEFDFHVRWPGVKLLTALLKNQCVSRLMDLLADSREVIRNDVSTSPTDCSFRWSLVGLLLLQQLTKGNAAIQKIVAFENAFERLLDIITEEGSSDGGIVVEDCLLLLVNLLKNNSSNQNFFKEGSYIQRMKPWFEVGDDNSGWSAQKVTNLHLMLQLVRVMVSPVNSPGATSSCQKSMYQCGLLQQLCTILMATGVPADILTETINTVSEVIRGSQINQDYFASVNAPSNPPRPAIVVLLMSMVNERQPFVLRCAVLYCFQCFLYKNQKGQGEIVATLLPSTIDANSISAGQLLCGGLFSTDSLSNWCAAVALAHALQDNLTQKEQLLRVQLATSLGKPPVSLLQQCTNILSQGDKINRRLTGQISENLGEDERLRIGKENFVEKLGFVTKHELYSRAAQKPQPVFPSPEQMLFDHEFTKLVKELEGVITKAVHKTSEEEKKEEEVKKTLEQHDSIVIQYKDLIRDQDTQIQELREQVSTLSLNSEQMQTQITQQQSQIQQHKDQYNILKLKLGKDSQGLSSSQGEGAHVNGLHSEELSQLREEVEELRRQHTLQHTQLSEKDSLINTLRCEAEAAQTAEGGAEGSDNTALLREVESLRSRVQAQCAEISQLQTERQELIRRAEAVSSAPAPSIESSADTAKVSELESRLAAQTTETERLKEECRGLREGRAGLEQQLASAQSTVAIEQTEKTKLQQEVQESKKEQDDLLMLLADQDQKILYLKQRLKDLGETIDEEEEDELDARDQFDDDEDEEEEEENND
ncbi:unnamed protein product [Coregonus sp. 'balchen']|nr:unnamed protein product [Coregonus sp. 'balchen']